MIKCERNGKENGKSAFLVKKSVVGRFLTFASIVFDGEDWIVVRGNRVDRFRTLREAKEDALKG